MLVTANCDLSSHKTVVISVGYKSNWRMHSEIRVCITDSINPKPCLAVGNGWCEDTNQNRQLYSGLIKPNTTQ